MRRVTIHDVAGKAGVSTAAVSHAFNDPERLRATTVTRILDAARELGYAPNPHARALHSQRVGVLGVLFPQPIATPPMRPRMIIKPMSPLARPTCAPGTRSGT